jgi:hypothetical protein
LKRNGYEYIHIEITLLKITTALLINYMQLTPAPNCKA